MVKARRWVLRSHFVGQPKREDLEIVEEELPPIKDGGQRVLVHDVSLLLNRIISVYEGVCKAGSSKQFWLNQSGKKRSDIFDSYKSSKPCKWQKLHIHVPRTKHAKGSGKGHAVYVPC